MKLSKAQQEVLEHAKMVIDYARTHSFYDWFRWNNRSYMNIDKMSDEEICRLVDQWTAENYIGNWEYQLTRYQWNRDGIDYTCHASSKTIQKLEALGLIEIIHDSNGEYFGFDVIRILNY